MMRFLKYVPNLEVLKKMLLFLKKLDFFKIGESDKFAVKMILFFEKLFSPPKLIFFFAKIRKFSDFKKLKNVLKKYFSEKNVFIDLKKHLFKSSRAECMPVVACRVYLPNEIWG